MKIDLSKKQYEVLLNAIKVAGSIYGVMGDMCDDKYKKHSKEMDELENHILEFAKEMNCDHFIEEFEGKKFLNDKYSEKITDDISEYEEFSFWDNLPRKLADRDLLKKYGAQKFKKINGIEYIHLEYPIEEAYRNEFDEHGIDRLEIKK